MAIVFAVAPGQADTGGIGVVEFEMAVERRIVAAEPHQLQEPLNDRFFHGFIHVLKGVELPIDIPRLAGFFCQVIIINIRK